MKGASVSDRGWGREEEAFVPVKSKPTLDFGSDIVPASLPVCRQTGTYISCISWVSRGKD